MCTESALTVEGCAQGCYVPGVFRPGKGDLVLKSHQITTANRACHILKKDPDFAGSP